MMNRYLMIVFFFIGFTIIPQHSLKPAQLAIEVLSDDEIEEPIDGTRVLARALEAVNLSHKKVTICLANLEEVAVLITCSITFLQELKGCCDKEACKEKFKQTALAFFAAQEESAATSLAELEALCDRKIKSPSPSEEEEE